MKNVSEAIRRAAWVVVIGLPLMLGACGGGSGGNGSGGSSDSSGGNDTGGSSGSSGGNDTGGSHGSSGGGSDNGGSDATAPSIIAVSPTADATEVMRDSTVTITFSEAIDCATVTSGSVTLNAGGSDLSGAIACSGSSATFTPSAMLAPNSAHDVTVTTTVQDVAGNQLATAKRWRFTTGVLPDTTSPVVRSVSPVAGALSVALNSALSVSFNEPVDCLTVNTNSFTLRDASNAVIGGTVTCSGSSASFTPSAPMLANSSYHAAVTTDVTDVGGNHLATAKSWNFITSAAPDATAPTVSTVTPANGATGVSISTSLSVSFSEPVNCASLTSTLKDAANIAVSGAIACSGNSVTFNPTADLAPNTAYTAAVGATDLAGNVLSAAHVWGFTTGAAPDTAPPTLDSATPGASASNVARTSKVTATFSEALDCTTATSSSFTLKAGTTLVDASVTCSGNIAELTPVAALVGETEYTATLTTDVKDVAGNSVSAAQSWSFTTHTGAWGQATLLDNQFYNATTPTIALDPNGKALAVWRQEDLTAQINVQAKSYADGAWGSQSIIESTNGTPSQPMVAFDAAGNGMAVWLSSDGANNHILANRYNAVVGWQSAGAIENEVYDASYAQLAVGSNGDAFVIWMQKDAGGIPHIWSNRFTAGAWGGAQRIDNLPSTAFYPRIAVDANGDAMAVWQQTDGTRYSIYANQFTVGAWGTAVLIENYDLGAASEPDVAFDANGNALAIWQQWNGTAYDLVSRHYTAGAGWDATIMQAEWTTESATSPRIVFDSNGYGAALWRQAPAGTPSLWGSRFFPSGWEAPRRVDSAPNSVSTFALVAGAHGDLFAIWLQPSGSWSIWASRFSPVSNFWAAPQLVENTSYACYEPSIAVDGFGNAAAVWSQFNGTNYDIYTNRFE